MFCYCKTEIDPDATRHELALRTKWARDDLRTQGEKRAVFCSFSCLASWAADRAAQHDGKLLVDGVDEATGNESATATAPIVDTTDRAVR